VVNRSIGPDQDDRDPGDRAYIHALTTPAAGAFGGGSGVFRSPAALPGGGLIASCDLAAADLNAGARRYGLCQLDATGAAPPRMFYSEPDRVAIEAALVYARVAHPVYASRSDEPNGSSRVEIGADDALVHYLDVPMLGTLLFANTRTGRPIDDRVRGIALFAAQPPPSSARSFAELGSDVVEDDLGQFFQSLRSLGHAGLSSDGSVRVRVPGGLPISVALTDGEGEVLDFDGDGPFSGPMLQREAMQFYPGERAKQSMPRDLFDGVCAGCHGSVSGRELDVGVSVDVLTSASATMASDEVVDLR
jgi:hypothetical protein